ncbi:MAG TPA: serine/threonine-protein kinase [Pseudonocardiaceae bacterium]|jgi:serine/threonine-protein kinase|nr:serine/threonine-protein kinase [Pseudonocardiaceae bacterium]
MTHATGQVLAARYRLGRRIAVGGMGEVWQATDTRLDRQVAVKVLKPELSGDVEFRHRFHTEARLTASLNHPGIAAVYDYGETSAAGAYLVMELVSGEPLAAALLRHGKLPVHRTLDILGQAGNALQAAHERGLVHRDVKPGNILLTPTGRVKLTDFGIAKAVDAAAVTRHGLVMGTAHYIAPEQAAGHEASPACDVYSLGVVGYECLAGQRPFHSDSAVAIAMMHIHDTPPPLSPDLPPGVRTLIETALAKDPRQRYRTGGELAAAVATVRAGHPPGPPATTVLVPGPQTKRYPGPHLGGPPPADHPTRRDAGRIAVALCVVLGLVLGGYLLREALRATSATSATPGSAATSEPVTAGHPEPTTLPPTIEEAPAEQPTSEGQSARVFVIATDYVLRSGSEAAATAVQQGLTPRVVNEEGEEINPRDQSTCLVTRVDPAAGWVRPGSSVVLTCKEDL